MTRVMADGLVRQAHGDVLYLPTVAGPGHATPVVSVALSSRRLSPPASWVYLAPAWRYVSSVSHSVVWTSATSSLHGNEQYEWPQTKASS